MPDDDGHLANPLQDPAKTPAATDRLNPADIPDTYHDHELRLVGLSG